MAAIEERLLARGIGIPDLVEAALALPVPAGTGSAPTVGGLASAFGSALKDPDIASILLGTLLLNDDAWLRNRHPPQAGEAGIGMLIAGMIGGTPAQRTFARYDRDHPATISGHGPVLDDAVAGLVAGCSACCGRECQ